MLAGVFLYKRPILWDARMAMEVFDGHHTKAQRQRGRLWYTYQSPLLPLWLHNTATSTAQLLLSAHADSKVKKPHIWGRNSHTFTQWNLAHILYGAHAYIYCIYEQTHSKRKLAQVESDKHTSRALTHLASMLPVDKSCMLHSNLWSVFNFVSVLMSFQRSTHHSWWQELYNSDKIESV